MSTPDGLSPQDPHNNHLQIDLYLAPGEKLNLSVETRPGPPEVQITQAGARASVIPPNAVHLLAHGLKTAWSWLKNGGRGLFLLAMLVYLATRLVGLVEFPVSFTGREAASANLAYDLLQNEGHNADGSLLPLYQQGYSSNYDFGWLVYLQLPAVLLFGKSVLAIRASEALVSSLTALWLSLILRDIYHQPRWWLAPLALAAVPTWFIHTRLALGYSTAVAFYSGFLYYYLLAFVRRPIYLYPAFLFGMLASYTSTSLPLILMVTAFLFFVSNPRHFWRQPKTTAGALLLLVGLVFLQFNFFWQHPGEIARQLDASGSLWNAQKTLESKLFYGVANYLWAINPKRWFFRLDPEAPLFAMKYYTLLPWTYLPFLLTGLGVAFYRVRETIYRLPLLSLVAVPATAALADPAARRMLVIVIPFVLFSIIGLDYLTTELHLPARLKKLLDLPGSINSQKVVYVLAGLLAAGAILMTADAVRLGPRWYSETGMEGNQYGARQVFEQAKRIYQNSQSEVWIEPGWLPDLDQTARFFIPAAMPVYLKAFDQNEFDPELSLQRRVYGLTCTTYNQLDPLKFSQISVSSILYLPDGRPAFYFVRLAYTEEIQKILNEEKALHRVLVGDQIQLNGQTVNVRRSKLTEGQLSDLFDNDPGTLIKTEQINPLVLEFIFKKPLALRGLSLWVGNEPVRISVTVNQANLYISEAGLVDDFKTVNVSFNETLTVSLLKIELLDSASPENSPVHLWGIQLEE
jgi:hypothetical protein